MHHHEETHPPMLPAAPCMATPDVAEQLREIRETQQEIRTALVGNPKLGHKGLVARVETVEQLAERHDRKLLVGGAIVTAAVGLTQFLKDKILGP
jgi:hypothetical protein